MTLDEKLSREDIDEKVRNIKVTMTSVSIGDYIPDTAYEEEPIWNMPLEKDISETRLDECCHFSKMMIAAIAEFYDALRPTEITTYYTSLSERAAKGFNERDSDLITMKTKNGEIALYDGNTDSYKDFNADMIYEKLKEEVEKRKKDPLSGITQAKIMTMDELKKIPLQYDEAHDDPDADICHRYGPIEKTAKDELTDVQLAYVLSQLRPGEKPCRFYVTLAWDCTTQLEIALALEHDGKEMQKKLFSGPAPIEKAELHWKDGCGLRLTLESHYNAWANDPWR